MEKGIKKTTSTPQITIVIGTLNRPNVVMSLINQLVEESKRIQMEVIVVDQSTLENYSELTKKFPKQINFKLAHFDKPNTVKYLNYGWKQAQAQVVLFLDDDVSLIKDTIQTHLNTYKNPLVRSVAGRVINDGEKISKDSNVGTIKWFGAEFTKNFSYEKTVFVDFPYGCNMSFRKQVFEEIGGFDEKLSSPIYAFNEVDLGYRINKRWKNSMIFFPEALVYHHKFRRGGTRNDFTLKEIFKSNQFNYGYFLGKNFSLFENIVCFIRRFPYQIIREPKAILYILKGFMYAKKTQLSNF